MHRHLVVLFFALLLIPSLAEGQQRPERNISQRVVLSRGANGVDGSLEIVSDARFSSATREKMWGNGDWAFVLSETDPLYKSFSATPPLDAELRIEDATGHVLAEEVLERPLARIEKTRLSGEKQTLFVTVDYSVGVGSYAGLTTMLLRVQNGGMEWVSATNPDTGKRVPIHLPKTLKTGWELSDAGRREILAVSCRPDSDREDNSTIRYITYRWDEHKGWLMYERAEKGMWESDEPFPSRTKFP